MFISLPLTLLLACDDFAKHTICQWTISDYYTEYMNSFSC